MARLESLWKHSPKAKIKVFPSLWYFLGWDYWVFFHGLHNLFINIVSHPHANTNHSRFFTLFIVCSFTRLGSVRPPNQTCGLSNHPDTDTQTQFHTHSPNHSGQGVSCRVSLVGNYAFLQSVFWGHQIFKGWTAFRWISLWVGMGMRRCRCPSPSLRFRFCFILHSVPQVAVTWPFLKCTKH